MVTIYFVPVSFSQVRLNILYLYLHGGGGLGVWRRFVKKKSDPSKFLQSTHKFIVLITFLYFQIYFPPIHVFRQALRWKTKQRGLINPLTVSKFRLQLQKLPGDQCWHRTDVYNIYYGSREWVKRASEISQANEILINWTIGLWISFPSLKYSIQHLDTKSPTLQSRPSDTRMITSLVLNIFWILIEFTTFQYVEKGLFYVQ